MNKLMAFALENMNVTPKEFWDLPPFAVINQMLIKAQSLEKDDKSPMNRKIFVDMLRAQNGCN